MSVPSPLALPKPACFLPEQVDDDPPGRPGPGVGVGPPAVIHAPGVPAAVEPVVAGATGQHVADQVGAARTVDLLVEAAEEPVVAGTADQPVGARPATDHVVAAEPVDHVVAAEAHDDVGPHGPAELSAPWVPTTVAARPSQRGSRGGDGAGHDADEGDGRAGAGTTLRQGAHQRLQTGGDDRLHDHPRGPPIPATEPTRRVARPASIASAHVLQGARRQPRRDRDPGVPRRLRARRDARSRCSRTRTAGPSTG